MGDRSIRILIIDDYEPWRRFVSATLQKQPNFQIIGDAADGLEAVQQAQELQPDLILLDIGLPTLNGIEAARRIHQVCPDAKILFASQNHDPGIVEAALSNGARGYFLKGDGKTELLRAIETVLRGDRFISGRLKI